jgi:hypothetical protein
VGLVDGIEVKGEVENSEEFNKEDDGRAEVLEDGIHLGMKRKKRRRREIHSRGKDFVYL